MIDFLNEQSNTYSMKRMNIKNALEKCITPIKKIYNTHSKEKPY